jgi:hypothetical protein
MAGMRSPTVTGNPTIDHWIAQGHLVPQAAPGTILDLLPLPKPIDDGLSLSDAVVAERDQAGLAISASA